MTSSRRTTEQATSDENLLVTTATGGRIYHVFLIGKLKDDGERTEERRPRQI